jgi:two-component system, cell cycle response regulator CpdR
LGRKSLVTGQKLVAIVDDEKDITVLFSDALQKIKGVCVLTFTDPKIALEHFKTNNAHYVVLLSDFRMPELNGIDLIKKIKDSNPSVRTILMTGFEINDEVFKDYNKKEIINTFLQKAISLDNLIKEVNTQLHLYELQKR